ncbi:TBC1 domain family member 24-like [Ictalurus furcatus]|uniref:TBC1 domain family member 24-like n=1 Tax=Ictalurus furcatus TaxID=66913 RepID=UPI00235049FE|nr:TBC1 domain family member 24-like [Ictalurus furcatus]
MLQVSPSFDFSSFGPVELQRASGSDGCQRHRSCSLFEPPDLIEYQRNFLRPRSRSFYMLDKKENSEDQQVFQADAGKLNNKGDVHTKAPPKRSTAGINKHLSKDHGGTRGNPKNIPMLTITEPDSWEISSCTGMKYGHYVDWEKIHPEAASRFQKVLISDPSELKEMARSGFWVTQHTLQAKSYQHLIHRIECTSSAEDSEMYHYLAGRIFQEHGRSTHPFPKFMKDGEIPRYCLNKSGLNSVKMILLCVSEKFPEMTFCPILPALVSLLLHYSEDEAQCFHSICSLVRYTDPQKRYIDQNFVTTHASCMTFGDLANKYCRGIRKLIASSHQSLFEFYSDWIMWIFADLPFIYAVRVLDVYLVEGYKVLYRVALALLSLYKVSVSSRVAHVEDFKQDMKSFVENVSRHSSTDALLQRAFSIQLPTRKELNFLYNANKQALIQKGIEHKSCLGCLDLGRVRSTVVSETEMRVVWAWIPERFSLFSPERLYSTEEHGGDLTAFYAHVEGHEPTVLLLKTVDEEVCGAFLSSDWTLRRREGAELQFFGTGECFVFTLRPAMERYQKTVLHISGMTGIKESSTSSPSSSSASTSCDVMTSYCTTCPAVTPRFLSGDDEMLFIGGDGGHALCLGTGLTAGQSERCNTFDSPVLCRGKFKIQSLEVWGIQYGPF